MVPFFLPYNFPVYPGILSDKSFLSSTTLTSFADILLFAIFSSTSRTPPSFSRLLLRFVPLPFPSSIILAISFAFISNDGISISTASESLFGCPFNHFINLPNNSPYLLKVGTPPLFRFRNFRVLFKYLYCLFNFILLIIAAYNDSFIHYGTNEWKRYR